METMNLRELRGRMAAHGITETALAREVGVSQPTLSHLFHGRRVLSPERMERLERVIARLGLARPASDEPLPSPRAKAPAIFRIRILSPDGAVSEPRHE